MEKKTIDPMLMVDKAIDMSMKLAGAEFPVSIFPNRIQRIIREVHECHSYPTDYIAASILTAIAVGIGMGIPILFKSNKGGKKVLFFTWH